MKFQKDLISRVFINFGAVDQIATVFINGAEVGSHKGGYTPFKFEITDYIKYGENEIRSSLP